MVPPVLALVLCAIGIFHRTVEGWAKATAVIFAPVLVSQMVRANAEPVRWPEDICKEIAGYEHMDVRMSKGDPVKRAYARENVLHMLRDDCGWDISKKEATDMAAAAAAVSSPSYSGGGDSGGGGWVEFDGPTRSKPSTHCTTMALGGGLSATDCD